MPKRCAYPKPSVHVPVAGGAHPCAPNVRFLMSISDNAHKKNLLHAGQIIFLRSTILMVEVNYRAVVVVKFNQSPLKFLSQVAVAQRKIPRNGNVENQFSARLVRHDTEIMQRQSRINFRQNIFGKLAVLVKGSVALNNGVNVQRHRNLKRRLKFALQTVGDFVRRQKFERRGHFNMH